MPSSVGLHQGILFASENIRHYCSVGSRLRAFFFVCVQYTCPYKCIPPGIIWKRTRRDLEAYKKRARRRYRRALKQRDDARAARDEALARIDELEFEVSKTKARLARARHRMTGTRYTWVKLGGPSINVEKKRNK